MLIGPRGWPLRHRLMFGVILTADLADYLRERLTDIRRNDARRQAPRR